jgi:PncC family amidohydrolase
MAVGAREHLHATLAVSTTGVAGPGGGTPDKPVGLVFVALARPGDKTTVRRLTLPGTRGVIQRRATVAALSMAWKAAR